MNNLLKGFVLSLVLSLPATFSSAQSATTGEISAVPATTVAAPAPNMLAMLTPEESTSLTTITTTATPEVAVAPEAAPAKTMSEELSGWVENKLAVVNSVKSSKRYK